MTAHKDTFTRDNLPPAALWPQFDLSMLGYPERMNAAGELLDKTIAAGHGDRPAFWFQDMKLTYNDLRYRVDAIAKVLVEEYRLVPGNRVLLRGPNNPMMVACWLAVLKAGGVAVATMPLLRAKELGYIVEKARIRFALCDIALADEMETTRRNTGAHLERIGYFTNRGEDTHPQADLDRAMGARLGETFQAVDTLADDPALIAFTSGTTGPAKGTVHFHRDVIAMSDLFPVSMVKITKDDIFTGSPPMAFTFGLGAIVTFPMRAGASTVLVEKFGPTTMLETIQNYKVTGIYTAPTAYRALIPHIKDFNISSLKKCISAGEHLPKATAEAWFHATGIKIIDGIGSTEMIHIFIAAAGDDVRFGSTGKAIPGYEAKIVDEDGNDLPPGSQGRLAVRGATGCRYLDNIERQQTYVQNGWNVTGDIYSMDEEGYFWYVARGDDMIISSGYNISGPEVENCLLTHPAVAETAVVGWPDEDRGTIVKAFVVLKHGHVASETLAKELQDHVKKEIAPYKYPRAIEFVDVLPKGETGKLQRFKLRQMAQA